MRRSLLFVFLVLSSLALHAEMYRWVDENGNVYFSDKKPPEYKAEDISDTVKNQNVDYGNRSAQKQLQQINRNKAAEKTEQNQREQISSSAVSATSRDCEEARRRLKIMRGRVIFYDDDNKEVKVTEKEREQRVVELERQIKKNCG